MLQKILLPICLLIGLSVSAQQPVDSAFHKLDSLSKKTDSAGFQKNNINPQAYNDITILGPKDYFILLGSNIKQGFTKPFHMTGRDWGTLAKFAVVAGATGLADEPIQRGVLKLRENSSAVRNTGKYISQFGGLYELYGLAGLGTYAFIVKNDKLKTTTLLASQAYITGGLLESVLKTISGRTRPNYYAAYAEAEPKFYGPFKNTSRDALGNRTNSSFPSGHTTVAFAAATVFAREYADRPLVPIIAYSAATLIGVSRITENKHWTSDVLVGAALGYLTGKQVVNNYHRFARLKNEASKKHNTMSFDLHEHFGKMMPTMVYHFG